MSRLLLTSTFPPLALPASKARLEPALLALPLNSAATSSYRITAFVYNATVCNLTGAALPRAQLCCSGPRLPGRLASEC